MEVTSERIFRFEQSDSDSPCEQVRISEVSCIFPSSATESDGYNPTHDDCSALTP